MRYRWLTTGLACAVLALLMTCRAHAQLASLFSNVTGIETRRLPNAVQVIVRTDGAVQFGGDLAQFVDVENGYQPKNVTSLRLRLLRARARLPSFVNIGAYPVDSAVVSLGTTDLQSPLFNGDIGDPSDPRVDIDLHFFVPVRVQRFLPDGQAYGSGFHHSDFLNPLEVDVTLGADRSSIVITVVSDRLDQGGAARLQRSPPGRQRHRLSVTRNAADSLLRVDALHAPLEDIIRALSEATHLTLTVDNEAASVDVSLLLPRATPDEALHALASGYNLVLTARPPADGGGFALTRGEAALVTERMPLHSLVPSQARLLFPDCLLPFLHTDEENNALLVSGSPALLARLRRDLALLDQPRPQVRVEVTAWEVATHQDAQEALDVTRTGSPDSEHINTDNASVALRLSTGQTRQFTATLTALATRGRARLLGRPAIIVASGAQGSLFLGQTRYISVLRQRNGRQDVQVVQLPVGSSLTVQPTVGSADEITLDLTPRFSTVDDIERGTGLPTLGIREIASRLRVRPDDSVVLASLDLESQSREARRLSPLARLPLIRDLFASNRENHSRTALMLLVTAHTVL